MARPDRRGGSRPLPLKEGSERYIEIYLVLAAPDFAGPGVRRLAQPHGDATDAVRLAEMQVRMVYELRARPESGAIWEKGRKTQTARLAVEKLASDREAHQRMARNAGTLNEIIAALAPGQGVMLSAVHFRELYQKIPSGIAAEMISPFDLLRFSIEKRWTRVYLEKSADGLMVYLLDSSNHVLRQLRIAAATLALMARRSDMASQPLEGLASFQNRIYPAECFFAALASLPEEDRRGLIAQPDRLLEVSGQITPGHGTRCSPPPTPRVAPWHVARSDDKKRARLNLITHLLESIPYKAPRGEKVKLPKRKIGSYRAADYPFKVIPEKF